MVKFESFDRAAQLRELIATNPEVMGYLYVLGQHGEPVSRQPSPRGGVITGP